MSDWDSGAHAGPKMGRTLELARKEKGLSLEQAEEATKIRASYLKELERDNFDVLPAVYVQGSLRTYANFLQLDGEALVQELKRRQAQEPTYVESRDSDFLDRALHALGGATVVGSRVVIEDEEDTGSRLLPAGLNRYLYLVSGVFLVLAAVALALTLPEDRQPAISQVRAPLISQAPGGVGGEEDARVNQSQREDEQGADDEGGDPRPEQSTRPPDEDAGDEGAGRTAQAGQDLDDSSPAPAEPEAAPPSPTTETPTRESDASAPAAGPANQNARGAGGARNTPTDGPRSARSGSRNGGGFDVRIAVGSDDPVRITGDVPGVDGGR